MWKLRFISDVEGDSVIDLVEAGITIGRDPENIVCIDHSSLSKFHAVLVRNGNDYRIFDVHSTNGTYVNGQRINAASLRDGDNVRVGTIELQYMSAIKRTVLRPQLGATTPGAPKVTPATHPANQDEPTAKLTAPAPVSLDKPEPPSPRIAIAPIVKESPSLASDDIPTSVPPPAPAEERTFIRTGVTQPPVPAQPQKATSAESKPPPAPPAPPPKPMMTVKPLTPSPSSPAASTPGPVIISKKPRMKLAIGGSSADSPVPSIPAPARPAVTPPPPPMDVKRDGPKAPPPSEDTGTETGGPKKIARDADVDAGPPKLRLKRD